MDEYSSWKLYTAYLVVCLLFDIYTGTNVGRIHPCNNV